MDEIATVLSGILLAGTGVLDQPRPRGTTASRLGVSAVGLGAERLHCVSPDSNQRGQAKALWLVQGTKFLSTGSDIISA